MILFIIVMGFIVVSEFKATSNRREKFLQDELNRIVNRKAE